jgi:hypothetical protein
MKAPWHDRTGLAKLLAIFLTALGVGLGLCGVTFVAFGLWPSAGAEDAMVVVAFVEAGIVALSFAGLVIVSVILVVRDIVRGIQSRK